MLPQELESRLSTRQQSSNLGAERAKSELNLNVDFQSSSPLPEDAKLKVQIGEGGVAGEAQHLEANSKSMGDLSSVAAGRHRLSVDSANDPGRGLAYSVVSW